MPDSTAYRPHFTANNLEVVCNSMQSECRPPNFNKPVNAVDETVDKNRRDNEYPNGIHVNPPRLKNAFAIVAANFVDLVD